MTLIGVSNQNIGTQFTTYSEVREKLLEVIVGVSRIGTCSLRWHLTENLQQWNVVFQIR
jgi:hypothetical protein